MADPPRKSTDSFRAVDKIFQREKTLTPPAGVDQPMRIHAWQMLLEVEADPEATASERKLARALRLLLSRSHGP